MHAPAAFQLTVSRFGVWRGGLAAAGLAVCSCSLAWWVGSERVLTSAVSTALLVALLVAGAALASLAQARSFLLRWDGQSWHLTHRDRTEVPGIVHVAIDAGAWLLLRFVPHGVSSGGPSCWLPVQRRGLESDWHRLRSTLFTARAAVPDPGWPAGFA